jgi:murein DD-endopeptidase
MWIKLIFTSIFLCILILIFSIKSQALDSKLFGLPIDCKLGKDCYIMHYVDRDPSPDIIDFGCGRQTYDGHDGIDFGITSLKQKNRVIASANGTILNLRDGVEDRLIANQADRNLIAGKECGNGVLIAHDNGWTTQYCHMKKNSITVRRGTKVSKGTSLGMVGSSGLASFPHVHLTVRQNGKAIDPFVGNNNNKSCTIDKKPLWTDSIDYVPTGSISAGFAPKVPTQSELFEGIYRSDNLPANIPSLVFWIHSYGVLSGDVEQWKLTNPKGEVVVDKKKTLDRDYRSWVSYTGVRKIDRGTYHGEYQLIRKNRSILILNRQISLE